MALTDENSMVMPVQPMYGGYGNGGGGFGFGGDWAWILLLLVLGGGWGGFGGFGMGGMMGERSKLLAYISSCFSESHCLPLSVSSTTSGANIGDISPSFTNLLISASLLPFEDSPCRSNSSFNSETLSFFKPISTGMMYINPCCISSIMRLYGSVIPKV